ncbi:hypothetical protein [Sphingomonas guangdongensis]|nr:hypothetical protein [Sphingomonas guangdongensis]
MRRIANADGLHHDAALAFLAHLVADIWVEADPDRPLNDDLRVRCWSLL